MTKQNESKSQYMIVNFTKDWKFSTQLSIENHHLEQVSEAKILGVWITELERFQKVALRMILKESMKTMQLLYN